ncbi:hypothetical protein BASA50_004607 [Batrachochytrium salamandrivorans]|uniref:J domain-containing protein n=1 Tax=Batrachochytrium salamandrivorans TaxID=1357716 RepID=A0ABQ8FF62_9FUNG|nr:hypothetical protein BASA62_008762 [Batrachochytrium salamandrivorans]KAH6574840.1 hypothetical protein BASA60_005311 [Batrachochytrium salamandrivorans]KAH6597256.1 hypothetical protein BASA50_004607 [Batrachochytrium salamandrivorans]KAH9268169.1 hypothetical protein BASA84_000364 [Batrachochytrium salamandrivorans]KAH9277093.1 hypothetical protein BASA83_000616 [Batrachochytrium salamandrivorans]
MSTTFYDILGVNQTSSTDEIRQGYIRESLKFHPDKNPDGDSSAKFQEIANAYYALSDEKRRAAYDESLLNPNSFFHKDAIDPFATFGNVFDELLVPEVPNPMCFWQPVGSVAGGLLGFIVLNIPGAVVGCYYGNRMGKIRDMKGMSVYEAFTKLSSDKRRDILIQLGKKLFTAAVGS